MRKIIATLLLLFPLLLRAQGLADWEAQTPGGNRMGDAGLGTYLQVPGSERISGITRWYFFHKHIIGYRPPGFFIMAENTGSITTFQSAVDWMQYQQTHHLVPRVWTRWYSDDWTFGRGVGNIFLALGAGWIAFGWAREQFSKDSGRKQRPRRIVRLILSGVV
ncbi:MAG: hypothetical protein EOO63_03945 [Hymenobacter sp.]|nr:MAG: hypothetical protein EOO63_03945 [Hymenobacter sp.]